MRSMRRPALLFLLALTACSDDSGTNPESGPTTEASATIQLSGGTLAVENESGVSLKVTFPPGAVLSPTPVTLRAIDPPAGIKARFVIEPRGLDLYQPATFTIKVPDGVALNENYGLSFTSGEPIAVPTDVNMMERTLTTSLYHFGFDLPVPVTMLAGSLGGAGNEFIDMDDFECQLARDQLTDAILRAQAFVGAFPPSLATPLIQQYKAALLVCESADSVAGASAILREYACSNVNSANATAHTSPVTTAAELKQSLGLLVAAEGLAQEAGADCHVDTSIMDDVFTEFLDAYIARINDPGFIRNFPTWEALWSELIVCMQVKALAQEYAVEEADEKIDAELFPALFARLREVGQEACAEDENNTFLLDIATGGHALAHPIIAALETPSFTGFPQDELVDEVLRCGSSVVAEAKTANNELLDQNTVAFTSPTGSVRVIRQGKIVLTNDILGFTCNGIVTRPPIRVRAEVPGFFQVVNLGNLQGSMTIPVTSTAAGLPEVGGEAPRNFDIVLERDRNVCGIDAPGTLELARISVNTHGFEGSAGGTWSGGCPSGAVSGTFVFTVEEDGTVTGTYEGSAEGLIAGTVLSNGTFDASANGTAGPCTWSGSLSIAGGALTGSGSWTCDVGCAGSFATGPLP